MQFLRRTLDGIADGSVTLAFRRWTRPQAKAGSGIRTVVGVVAFDSVRVVDPATITEAEARMAGHADLAELLSMLDNRAAGKVYRIGVRLAGADPRIAMREQSELDDAELAALRAKLSGMDGRSPRGPWTGATLRLIEANKGVRAGDLAEGLGLPTQRFKTDVRKLKELGLTESLEVGYRISPRGRALLAADGSSS